MEDIHSFQDLCSVVMEWLLKRKRSISLCVIDGVQVQSLDQAENMFTSADTCEIESVTIEAALMSALALQGESLKTITAECEELVTECLLAEPEDIIKLWQKICEHLKAQIGFVPHMGAVLSDEEVERLVSTEMSQFNRIMQRAGEILSTADVVQFSDLLELELIPWLGDYRLFLHRVFVRLEKKLKGNEE